MKRRVAVILSDTLQSAGLQSLLSEYFPPVEVDCFASWQSFAAVSDAFDYYFTTPDTFVLNTDYFLPRRSCTLLLMPSAAGVSLSAAGVHIFPTDSSSEILLEQLQILFTGDGNVSHGNHELSTRETDVLRLIVRGMTNKKIADNLHISLNTVLTHRKNITAKLGIKTVSGLTIYALMTGRCPTIEQGADLPG